MPAYPPTHADFSLLSSSGTVLLDENLKEINLSSPTVVGPEAFSRLQRAIWSDTGFLSNLGVMDYSLLVGVDKRNCDLVVGVIDFIRQASLGVAAAYCEYLGQLAWARI